MIRRALAWLLCLALAGQQAVALAAVPCEHDAGVRAEGVAHALHGRDAVGADSHGGAHAGHADDSHAMNAHASHAAYAIDSNADARADATNHDGCDCGCAMAACVQTASSMLPSELTIAHAIAMPESPRAEPRTFAPDCAHATPHRPPIAA